MGRTVPGLKAYDVREYIPQSFNNRADPQPIKIWIRNPSEQDKREILSQGGKARFAMGPTGPVLGPDGLPKIEVETADSWVHQHAMVAKFVTKVENYRAPGGDPIVDGAGLARHGDTEVVSEVATEIQAPCIMSEDERKNSQRPPASSSEGSAGSDGTAGAVTKKGSGRAEAATAQP
jgi:hypothetical protein